MSTSYSADVNSSNHYKKYHPILDNIMKHKILYLMTVPGILYFIIFHYIPLHGLVIAFQDFKMRLGVFGSPWIGFKNFSLLFNSPDFFLILRNTLVINLLSIIFGFPGPIIVAILLNEITKQGFKRTIQTIIYFPHFLSWVIVGGIVIKILSPSGIVNDAIYALGLERQQFLTSSTYFRWIIVLSGVWKEVGWGAIIYLAALSGIDVQLYEAAYVDGANKFKQIWHITLPALLPTIAVVFILRVGRMLNVGFEQIFVLYNPTVYDVSDVFSTYIYRVGIGQARFSYTTAVGMFQSVTEFMLVLLTNRLANKVGDYGIW